ncbi:MAG TPA: multifunctional oxoglutarate decarboxylase/oxoglutarate dehydrogenase thiamine pyrophosphate-binding subunit/dihydrolipoyllysine-residue succinyltransferase subunit [Gemmatimonadales bacterium]|nr:multifunctional oxoglutarate decarboxylase/oxoglutarate dehydrogenase thiamine pyrophosphate-binding subunit/dihydrolipoyllysine-residue succinyltransferase subunit [Gemmatimonadales bacterium]
METNPFETANAGFAQALYEEFLRDPGAVSPEWRRLFESGVVGEAPSHGSNGSSPAATTQSSSTAAVAPPASAASPATGTAPAGGTALKGPAARLAANMAESLTVPTATTFREVPVAVLESRRRELNAELRAAGRLEKVSFTHLIGHALSLAARRHPVMTHSYTESGGTGFRVDPGHVNLGLAVDVERKDGSRGLVVPVISHAESLDFKAFHAVYEGLVEKARAGKLMPDAFAGATISLTNPGGLGTTASVPRLMAGQGSIIAVGAIGYPAAFAGVPEDRLREMGVARAMTVSSTYDHRIIQGAESGEFLRTLDGLLQGEERFFENVFESLGLTAPALRAEGAAPARPLPGARAGAPIAQSQLFHVAAAMALVKAHRTHGHLAAHLDPLGSPPVGDPSLDPAPLGLTPENMAEIPASVLRIACPGRTLAEALPNLQAAYCGTIAYELEHISVHEERVWLRQMIESGAHRTPLPAEERRRLLARLTQVESLETFLHKAYLGQKRFSIEGVDTLVPMLDLVIEMSARAGAREVVIGMAHRGRLNVLAHTVRLPYESIFAEFEGGKAVDLEALTPEGGTGDVKYHHGAEGAYKTSDGRAIAVGLVPNPSHLEFVGAVVDGRARARQTQRKGREAVHDQTAAVPVIIHGDAAFAGQGVVAETLNLGALRGYSTGGTIHIITNNQIGFTTDMQDARSTRHASDAAKGWDVPIIHVNADDAEGCLAAIRLAMAYREKFAQDVLIDQVGYRRHGHNEGDEPAYTQPLMYERIKSHPTVRAVYAAQLAAEGVQTEADSATEAEAAYQRLIDVQQSFKSATTRSTAPEQPKVDRRGAGPEVDTAVPEAQLTALNEHLLTWPEGFTVNPKLRKQLERRRPAMGASGGIDWAHGEALALGSLLAEGVPIRFTGQDTERGTFSQRHLVQHDAVTGAEYCPIQHLPGALAPLELHNSPLSELATLGFEYGYSAAAPEALVLWEAQYGDFVNGAQVIIDQFLVSGLSKWGLTTRLTLLLPHGYEGGGPEHSSARLERFLQLAAEGNIRVANATTAAQYFHLLRRQAKRTRQRPLVVMTPKSLLRLPQATSTLAELATGRWHPVLDDSGIADPKKVTRILLCSGKVYYDLMAEAAKNPARPAIVRLEQLFSFPEAELKQVLARYPAAKELVWVQEEPQNMGAWSFVERRIERALPDGVQLSYVGRPERASPAEGYPAAHSLEQKRIVTEALG